MLGGVSTSAGARVKHFIGAVATTLIGTGFFFAIVGVFGLRAVGNARSPPAAHASRQQPSGLLTRTVRIVAR